MVRRAGRPRGVSKVPLVDRIPAEVDEELRDASFTLGMKRTDLITLLIRRGLEIIRGEYGISWKSHKKTVT